MARYNLFRMSMIGVIGFVETINANTDKAFTKIKVASKNVYKKGEETIEETEWIEVIVPKKATISNFIVGRKVFIEGTPKANAYTTKEGVVTGSLQIVGATIRFIDANPGTGQEPEVEESTEEGMY